jgi:uncharacterized protein (TIGR02145 family)
MKPLIGLLIILYVSTFAYCQEVEMTIQGAIKIGNTNNGSPNPGTIRWTGTDLEVYKNNVWVSLTQGSTPPSSGTITDIDGNIYATIVVDGTEWMAENLRTTKYRNGANIDYVTNQTDWNGRTVGAFCWYENQTGYENPYGKLYNWYAVADSAGLCPTGWSVASQVEWATFSAALGGNAVAGGKMKEVGTAHWSSPNIAATNESGFTGLPGGSRSTAFVGIGAWGNYWTITSSGSSAHYVYLNNQGASLGSTTGTKYTGMSVRCRKN